MTSATFDVRAHRRFFDDFRRLPQEIAKKTLQAVETVRSHGARYPSLHTRRIQRNADARFHFVNVDDKYRMVAAFEGNVVLLEKVGNHDETERWGEAASLDEYAQRFSVAPDELRRETTRPQRSKPRAEQLFETGLTLPQIIQNEEKVSDLLAGDLFGALKGYRDGTIEDWMVFLSPLQRRAVERTTQGPGRVTGGPGTGKSVVGLHRAAAFARGLSGADSVLVTSFVRTVPDVLQGLFERLAPELIGRVRFEHIHALAMRTLRDAGISVDANADAAKSRFDDAFTRDKRREAALKGTGVQPGYAWEELTRVVEGRGVTTLDRYVKLERHGRVRPMTREARSLLWGVFEDYWSACARHTPLLASWERVLGLALTLALKDPPSKKYDAVIVDEAQDLTEVGIRFLLSQLTRGAQGQILLIGDGGQRIYAGGFRLSDLAIEIRGRSFVLDQCYRSTDEIMKVVGALGRTLSTQEFGEEGFGKAPLFTLRTGPPPRLHIFDSHEDEASWLLGLLATAGGALDDWAVLTPTNKAADEWHRLCRERGVRTVKLLNYEGRPVPGVKIGTYHRAKGIEFKRVFLPGLNGRYPQADRQNDDSMLLLGSQLYVAMSRARDEVDVSYSGRPSLYLEPLIGLFDTREDTAVATPTN